MRTEKAKATVKPIRGRAMSKGWLVAMRNRVLACPREAEHVYGPDSYLAWHEWADEMMKAGWRAHRCECDLYLLVTPPSGRNPPQSHPSHSDAQPEAQSVPIGAEYDT